MEAEVERGLSSFGPQDLAQMIWALGRLRHECSERWLSRVLEVASEREMLVGFSGKDVALMSWGLVQQERCSREQLQGWLDGGVKMMMRSNVKLKVSKPQVREGRVGLHIKGLGIY